MELLVRAFPVLPGMEGHLRQFADGVAHSRATEAGELFRRLGVARESWHIQQTSLGTWVIAVTQISDRSIDAAGHDYAASDDTFARWFKSQVVRVTGVDPDETPLGPPTECIFDFHSA